MTEQECIEVLKQPCYCDYDLSATIENCDILSCDRRDAMKMAIKALEEIQQYRALGTVEELRVARDKQMGKQLFGNDSNPIVIGETVSGLCPECLTKFVCITPAYYKANGYGYCKECGQKLDWSDDNE